MSARRLNYYDDWKHATLTCPKCGCPNAVDYASSTYLAYQGYRQGISPSDPLFPDEYVRRVEKLVFRFSLAAYQHALDHQPPAEKKSFARA